MLFVDAYDGQKKGKAPTSAPKRSKSLIIEGKRILRECSMNKMKK